MHPTPTKAITDAPEPASTKRKEKPKPVELRGPHGRVVVPADEAPDLIAKGYTVPGAPLPKDKLVDVFVIEGGDVTAKNVEPRQVPIWVEHHGGFATKADAEAALAKRAALAERDKKRAEHQAKAEAKAKAESAATAKESTHTDAGEASAEVRDEEPGDGDAGDGVESGKKRRKG